MIFTYQYCRQLKKETARILSSRANKHSGEASSTKMSRVFLDIYLVLTTLLILEV